MRLERRGGWKVGEFTREMKFIRVKIVPLGIREAALRVVVKSAGVSERAPIDSHLHHHLWSDNQASIQCNVAQS